MEKQKTNKFVSLLKKYFNKERIGRILPATLISLAVALIIFICVPLDIYCANSKELRFSFSDIFGRLAVNGLCLMLILFLVQFIMPKIVYKILRGIIVGFALMLFLQSNYLNTGLTSLAGDDVITVTEMVGKGKVIANTIIWGGVILGCTLASVFVKKVKIVNLTALVLTAVILLPTMVTTSVNALTTDFAKGSAFEEMKAEEENYTPTFLTTKNMTNLATDSNVVVFVIDRLDDGKYFGPNKNKYKHYFESWGGFTYFTDNISMYGRTFPSVAYMLSNKHFNPSEENRKEFFIRAYQQNNTLKKLDENGYNINIYTDTYYGYYDAYYLPSYIDNLETATEESLYRETTQTKNLFRVNTMMGLYRVMPFAFKENFGGISSTSLNKFVVYKSDQLEHPEASTDMRDTYYEVSKDFTVSGEKQFSFIHVSGCHNVDYNENWEKSNKKEKKNMNISLKNSFEIINEYIEEMKKAGVYQNSTIIITGDHALADDNFALLDKPKLTSLFVKPKGVGGDKKDKKLVENKAQVSQENLWGTIFASEGIDFDLTEFEPSVFDIDQNQNRVRKHVWHTHTSSRTNFNENFYEIIGSAKDFKNWKKTETKKIGRELYD